MSIIIYILFQKTNIVKKKPFQKNPFTLKAKTSRSHVSFITVYVKGFPFLCMLLQIFLFGCQPASDMSLRLIDIQHYSGLRGKGRIDMYKPIGDIFVYGGLTDAELFCRVSHRRIVFYDIIGDFHGPLLNIVLQETPLNSLFLQCMQRCGRI